MSTQTLARHPSDPRPLGVVLRVHGARATPAELELRSGRCTVGAMQGVDLVIDSPTVSRKHVDVELVPQGLRLTDLGSRNGTFYLGQRIERAVLAPGSRVRLGEVELSFDVNSEDLDAPPPFSGTEHRGLVGSSPAMRRLFGALDRLAGTLVTVLIEGESGVGKELVAHAIHQGSSVATGPFTVVNCGALPRDLVASELFGHVKGAFTGASRDRAGAFEQARGGTLFLDEIAELPLEAQPTLLRILENHELRPVGGERAVRVDARVISATNRSLQSEVERGRFREDLYYRLAVVRLPVAPLRERREDIELLARRLSQHLGIELPASVVEHLKSRNYPGNVRELRNVIQAYGALGELPPEARVRPGVLDSVLGDFVDPRQPYTEQKENLVERFTRAYLQAVLDEAGGNQTRAAQIAGLSRTHLSAILGKLGLLRRDSR